MASETWAPTPSVKEDLLAHGERYSYFQAIRLLRLFEKNTGAARAENLRIRPQLSLTFPDNDIAAIEPRPEGGYRITANFFGLYGVSSPLPTFYTEDLFEEEREGQHAQREFIDIVHYALYPLLFEAWSKYRLEQRLIENEDEVVQGHMHAFVGLLDKTLRQSLQPDSAQLLRYAGLFFQRPRSVLGLKILLADAFAGADVCIDSCIARTVAIPADQQWSLGVQGTHLGDDAYLGAWMDDYNSAIRIQLTDLSADLFHRLLPGEADHQRLRFLTRYYLTTQLEVEVELGLRASEVEPARTNGLKWSRLGWDTWLAPEKDRQPERVKFAL